jgi:tetratricopeptide (TPR) repeat protein
MANFGVTFALLGADSEFIKVRIAAVDRTLALVDAKVGSELERGYVYALTKLLEEGPLSAADAFGQVSRKFPNDVQAKLFESYFRRAGFDEYGSPKPEQELAQEMIQALMKKQPDSPMLMHCWLMMRTENLLCREDLPMARKLCELVPDYPPYYHLLGHYEWRSGNYRKAVSAFSRCGDLYLAWMKQAGLSIVDCPEWIRAEVYRAVALASSGDYDSALDAASALTKVPIPLDRMESAGARMMYWEAKTLQARLLMRRGAVGDAALALQTIPQPDEVKSLVERTKVGSFYQGLVIALEGGKALTEGNKQRAEEMYQLMILHGEKMEAVRQQAMKLGEIAPFSRAFICLEILALELKGNIAMASGSASSGAAYNWYSGARERQTLATRMLPPISLFPMSAHVAQHFEVRKDWKSAQEAYEEGLEYWPNDLILLEGLKNVHLQQKNQAAADKAAAQIQQVKSE